jgi:hypothetical protein
MMLFALAIAGPAALAGQSEEGKEKPPKPTETPSPSVAPSPSEEPSPSPTAEPSPSPSGTGSPSPPAQSPSPDGTGTPAPSPAQTGGKGRPPLGSSVLVEAASERFGPVVEARERTAKRPSEVKGPRGPQESIVPSVPIPPTPPTLRPAARQPVPSHVPRSAAPWWIVALLLAGALFSAYMVASEGSRSWRHSARGAILAERVGLLVKRAGVVVTEAVDLMRLKGMSPIRRTPAR